MILKICINHDVYKMFQVILESCFVSELTKIILAY